MNVEVMGDVPTLKIIQDFLQDEYFKVGDKIQYSDVYAECIGEVKFGEYIQDGSGGEYSGTRCIGFYIEVIDLKPLSWDTDTSIEELKYWYPSYLRTCSILQLLKDCQNYDGYKRLE